MGTDDLAYAEQNLPELFEDARSGEDVIIVRSDGRSGQLLPIADVKETLEAEEKWEVQTVDAIPGALYPRDQVKKFCDHMVSHEESVLREESL